MGNFYAPGHKYNVNAMRREARKRAKRDGRSSVIHRHHVDEKCDDFEHEEIGPDDVE